MFAQMSRLFKHSVVYGMSETISRGTGFILMFIYVRILTDSQIGIRTLLYFASAFLGLFYTLGLDNAFLRYFMDEDYADKKSKIFSTAICFTALTGLLFFIVAVFLGKSISFLITESYSYLYLTRLLFIILILDTIVIYPSLVLRAENRFKYYSMISIARFFLFILLNLVMVWYLDRGVNGVFEANLIAVLLVFFFLLPVYGKYFSGQISFSILKRMLIFGIPTIFTIFAMRIIDLSDRRMIQYFLGESQVGQYSYAYTLGMVGIMVFVNSFRTAWQPFFLSLKSSPEVKNIFSRVATYYAMFICMIFLGIVLFKNEIFYLYAPGKPLSLSNIIPYVAFSYIIYGFYIIMLPGVFFREKTIYLPFATVTGAVVNVGLNFIFIPRFGIIGAAYTTIISYAIMVIILYFVSRYIYLVKYELVRLGAVFLFTAVPIVLSFMYQPDGLVTKLFYNSALFVMPLVIYYFSNFLKPEEQHYIRQIVRKVLSA